jgi:hypothetical protein
MPGSVGVVPAGEPRGLRVAADHEIAVVFLPRAVIEGELLLARSELPIAAVAGECGFSHHQHLAASFARLVGTSPSRFRRASAEQELAPIAQGRGSRAARRTRESPASTAVEPTHPEGGGAC